MRWVFVVLSYCLTFVPAAARDRLEPIQACPLARLSKPVAASRPQCAKSHCVELGQDRSICKCLPDGEEQPSHLVLFHGDKEIQRWRADAYLQQMDDFEVLSGDLRGDGKPLWIVANHELSSQGILVRFWSLHVLDPAEPAKPPISWSVSDYGPGSFALPRSRQKKGCDILVTEWLEGEEAGGKNGLYFRGEWHRLGAKDLTPLPSRQNRIRRYLFSFVRERVTSEDGGIEHLKGRPDFWLRPEKAVPHDPNKVMLRLNTDPSSAQ
ncbi:hypothetical protein MHY87_13990 [Microvirga sp. ACRRW]|uniref:hypothetical protein n=1 Tax=Microvirga sp. ACRRW TaxID=2918205 RepID=UPI001EF5D790|nr:hypothetical protein [Microvirga sp. ACRRW]MCG7394018.1 hypothetical protein [Microvirga sp. ACRRW]